MYLKIKQRDSYIHFYISSLQLKCFYVEHYRTNCVWLTHMCVVSLYMLLNFTIFNSFSIFLCLQVLVAPLFLCSLELLFCVFLQAFLLFHFPSALTFCSEHKEYEEYLWLHIPPCYETGFVGQKGLKWKLYTGLLHVRFIQQQMSAEGCVSNSIFVFLSGSEFTLKH